MEPTSGMFHAVMYPTAAFMSTTPPDFESYSSLTDSQSWEKSYLNPKNRIESLTPVQNPSWRIDGGEADGTRFFTVPSFAIGQPPLRIDTFIPDTADHAPELREILKANSAMQCEGSQISNLSISQFILRILENWSRSSPGLETLYRTMPFGSRIVIDNICSNFGAINVHLIPRYEVERQWLTVDTLQQMWNLSRSAWPDIIDLNCVQLQRQFHDAIALVNLRGHGTKTFVFKSVTTDLKFFYHELKLLLCMDAHPNIVSPPLYIVTKKCQFGGKVGVCGFILKYYTGGTLQETLWKRWREGTLNIREQFRWAREVTAALIHIKDSPAGFYSDLKLNNIIMDQRDDGLHAVVVDFEQRGGWYSWSPPEVYYTEYLEYVACSSHVDDDVRERYTAVLKRWKPDWEPNSSSVRYWKSEFGFSVAWVSLSEQERERAQVFMLGKLLWCLFEGVGSINSCVTVETFRDEVSEQHFPEFRQTPKHLRTCIRKYTSGATEWRGRYPAVVRRGNMLFPREMYEKYGASGCTSFDTQEAARRWWTQELSDAERFVESRYLKREEGLEVGSVFALQDKRPLLQEVLRDIQEIEAEVLNQPYN
ncbi:hypothetical protein N431DRAFT_346688 [Stipitochalara longipes BDJ]|nr:hypothetical protein N431DRAFT_346688 [Stipitochalara longipes BDJ]